MDTQINLSDNTVYWKTRKLGEIYPSESTFESVKRTPKNLFRLFDGLGLNRELLNLLDRLGINTIHVPYCGKILETTTKKWLSKGIPLPQKYCSDRVDEQLILPMDKINLDEDTPVITETSKEQLSQLSFFDNYPEDSAVI